MARDDAVSYIKKMREEGFSSLEIRRALEKSGWPVLEIDTAFIYASASVSKPPAAPVIPRIPPIRAAQPPANFSKPPPATFAPQAVVDVKPASVRTSAPAPAILELPKKETPSLPPVPRKPLESPTRVTEKFSTKEPTPQAFGHNNVVDDVLLQKRSQTALTLPAAPPAAASTSSSKTKVVLASLVIFCLGAGGAGAYWYFTKIYPQQVFADALAGLKNAASFAYDSNIVIEGTSNLGTVTKGANLFMPQVASLFLAILTPSSPPSANSNFTFTIKAKGMIDYHDPQKPKQQIRLALGTEQFLLSNIEFESRRIGDTYYFAFTKLPYFNTALYGGSVPPFDTKSFEGKWVSFEPAVFKKDVNGYLDKLSAADPTFRAYKLNATDTQDLISKNDAARIRELWDNTQFISWDNTISSETQNGKSVYHAHGQFNKEALLRFIEGVAHIKGESFTSEIEKQVRSALEYVKPVAVDMLVGKSDRKVHEISVNTSFTDPAASAKGEALTLSAHTSFSGINEPHSVEVPSGAESLGDLLNKTMGTVEGNLTQAQAQARDAERVTDLAQIKNALLLYQSKKGDFPQSLGVLSPEFIVMLPKDPKTKTLYKYKKFGKGKFILSAHLENKDNPALLNDAHPGDSWYDMGP